MVTALLLAAGAGRRFGGAKLLAPLADGTPLILAAARPLLESTDDLLAVVRPEHTALQNMLAREGIEWTVNPRPDRGLGSSIAHGVWTRRGSDGWLVALGDMPSIQPATVRAVAEALADGAPLAAPLYQGRRGHPVGFAKAFREELQALDGDTGAREVLARNAPLLEPIRVDDPGILKDVDTPDDLAPAPAGRGAK